MATKMLMFKSVRDQALHAKKSKIMEPEKQIIEKRFENDSWNPERYEAISALHKKYDAGFKLTLLMPLLQMPLMLAFFSIAQIAVEFRHERFFWIADMSQKDPYYILPVLASVMMMLQFSSTSAQQNSPMGDEYKMVFKLMPLLMLYMARQWPAVACFYLVSNAVLSFAQDKLLALSK
jgi:YidC/Oxa1 family membrane protein insertase